MKTWGDSMEYFMQIIDCIFIFFFLLIEVTQDLSIFHKEFM